MNQDIKKNSVVSEPLLKLGKNNSSSSCTSTPTPTTANRTQPVAALELDTSGAGDDSGNFSEIMDTITTAPSFPICDDSNNMLDYADPKKLTCNLLSTSEKSETLLVTDCCEQVNSSCDNSICRDNSEVISSVNSTKSDSYLYALVSNFNLLYEGKLADVDKSSGISALELLREKSSLYQDWIKDLNEQNSVLIDTVEEMEREAEQKIEILQRKMEKSTKHTEEHMTMITEYEKQVQEFLSQRIKDEGYTEGLRAEISNKETRYRKLQDQFRCAEAEVENLVTLITRVRDMGVWDITGLKFESRTNYRLFELYPKLPGSEVQTVFTREKAKKAREAEKQLEHLATKFEDLICYKTQFEEILAEKDKHLKDLEKENQQFKTKVQDLEQVNKDTQVVLDDTQALLMESNMKSDETARLLQAHETEMMMEELRELKNQLSITCAERQNAMKEASLLKNEMNQRVDEIHQMKNLLRSIQAETESTKSQVKDVQDRQIQLSPLKEQAQLYQSKYEEAKLLLRNKSDTIENLQTQMDQLQEKVCKIELACPSSFFKLKSYCSKNSATAAEMVDQLRDLGHRESKPPWNEHFVKSNKSSLLGKDADSIALAKDYADKLFGDPVVKSTRRTAVPVKSKISFNPSENQEFMKNHQKINQQILNARRKTRNLNESENDAGNVAETTTTGSTIQERLAQYFSDHFGVELDIEKTKKIKPPVPNPTESQLEIIHRSQKLNENNYQRKARKPNPNPGNTKATNRQTLEVPSQSLHNLSTNMTIKRPNNNDRQCQTAIDYKEHIKKHEIADFRTKTLDALVSAAVQASQQMIDNFSSKEGLKMKVTATRTHHRRQEQESKEQIRRNPSRRSKQKVEPQANEDQNQNPELLNRWVHLKSLHQLPAHLQAQRKHSLPVTTIYKNKCLQKESYDVSKIYKQAEVSKNIKKPDAFVSTKKTYVKSRPKVRKQVMESVPQQECNFELPAFIGDMKDLNPEVILAALPIESQEFLVRNWITTNTYSADGFRKSLSNCTYDVKKIVCPSKSDCACRLASVQEVHPVLLKKNKSDETNSKFASDSQAKLLKMEDQVTHWVSNKEANESDTDERTSTNSNHNTSRRYHSFTESLMNNNAVIHTDSFLPEKKIERINRDLQKTTQELQSRVSHLESQILSRDTVISSLHCEIEVEKLTKAGLRSSMESKDAEITMQKVNERKEQLVTLRNQEEIISTRVETLEKNLLLYRSYNLLSTIEQDYPTDFQFRDDHNPGADPLIHEIDRLREIRMQNLNLRRKLDEELVNISKLQVQLKMEMEASANLSDPDTEFQDSELAKSLWKLEAENYSLKNEIRTLMQKKLGASSEDSTNQLINDIVTGKVPCLSLADKLKLDIKDMIQDMERQAGEICKRNKQIAGYEAYVKVLHKEMHDWIGSNGGGGSGDHIGLINSDIIELRKIVEDLQRENQRVSLENLRLLAAIEQMKTELEKVKASELELRHENAMLKLSFETVSNKMGGLVGSFEFLQDQWQSTSSAQHWDQNTVVESNQRNSILEDYPYALDQGIGSTADQPSLRIVQGTAVDENNTNYPMSSMFQQIQNLTQIMENLAPSNP